MEKEPLREYFMTININWSAFLLNYIWMATDSAHALR